MEKGVQSCKKKYEKKNNKCRRVSGEGSAELQRSCAAAPLSMLRCITLHSLLHSPAVVIFFFAGEWRRKCYFFVVFFAL